MDDQVCEAAPNKWTQRRKVEGGGLQTEPTRIVCWGREDNAGQR